MWREVEDTHLAFSHQHNVRYMLSVRVPSLVNFSG